MNVKSTSMIEICHHQKSVSPLAPFHGQDMKEKLGGSCCFLAIHFLLINFHNWYLRKILRYPAQIFTIIPTFAYSLCIEISGKCKAVWWTPWLIWCGMTHNGVDRFCQLGKYCVEDFRVYGYNCAGSSAKLQIEGSKAYNVVSVLRLVITNIWTINS